MIKIREEMLIIKFQVSQVFESTVPKNTDMYKEKKDDDFEGSQFSAALKCL